MYNACKENLTGGRLAAAGADLATMLGCTSVLLTRFKLFLWRISCPFSPRSNLHK